MRRLRWMIPCVGLIATMASRAGAQGWARTIGQDGWDSFTAMDSTADGGFVAAGFTSSSGDATVRPWIVRFDAAGLVLWQKTCGTGSISCISQAADGGFLVAGEIPVGADGAGAPWLLRLDASGDLAWQRTIRGLVYPEIRAIAALDDGGHVLAGVHVEDNDYEAWLLTVDAAAVPVRQWGFALPGIVEVRAVQVLPDGSFLLAGMKHGALDGIWLMRVDAAGAITVPKVLRFAGAHRPDDVNGLEPTLDGGWIVSGNIHGSALDDPDVPFAMKLDADLEATWARALTTPFDLTAGSSGIRQTTDGGYILAGWLSPFYYGPYRRSPETLAGALAVKLDAAGAIEWQRVLGPGRPGASALVATPDGGAILAGGAASSSSAGTDALLLRLDAAGLVTSGCAESTDSPLVAVAVTPTATDDQASPAPFLPILQPTFSSVTDTSAPLVEQGDRHEPDDACGDGFRLTDGATTHHDFCDDAEDWFELQACAGATYSIETSNLGSLANTIVYVLAPGCAQGLAVDDDGGGGRASRLEWTAPADGRYGLLVRQRDGSSGGHRAYDLTLERLAGGCATWARTYGIASREYETSAVRALPDGTFVVIGTVGDGLTGPTHGDPAIARLGAHGDVTWHVRLLEGGTDVAADIETTSSGRVIASSHRNSSPHFAFVSALDAAGNIEWQQGYVTGGRVTRVRRLRDGRIAVVGRRSDGRWLLLLDDDGQPTFHLALGITETYGLWDTDLVEAPDADLLLFAWSRAPAGLLVMRIDPSGTVRWQRIYAMDPGVPAAAASADGGYFVAVGASVVKLDGDGNVAWRRTFTGPAQEPVTAAAIVSDSAGGCAVAGIGVGAAPLLLKLNAHGNVEWARSITDPQFGLTRFTSVDRTLDLGYILAARTNAVGNPADPLRPMDVLVMRLDRDGQLGGSCPFDDANLIVSSPATTWIPAGIAPIAGSTTVTDAGFTASDRGAAHFEICSGNDPRPPWEVSPPGSIEPLIFTDHETLWWEPAAASGSSRFNLYRGDVAGLRSGSLGSCFAPDLPFNAFQDRATPSAGIWTYLVTGENAAGEGTMGRNSLGAERVNAAACP